MGKNTAAPPKLLRTEQLALAVIRIDGNTQPRAELDKAVVAEYMNVAKDAQPERGTEIAHPFPPVDVFYDGRDHWLADGFHRRAGYKEANLPAINANIYEGGRREAVLHSVGANNEHGLRRSNADKRRSVETLVNDEEWSGWSNNEIARHCKVGPDLVADVRKSILSENDSMKSDSQTSARSFTHPKTGKPTTMNTANIGKKPAAPAHDIDAARAAIAETQRQIKASQNGTAPHLNGKAPEPDPIAPELTDEEWLHSLPIYRHLSHFQHKALLLRHDLLAYRTLEQSKVLSNFHHHAGRAINFTEGGSTPFSRQIIAVAHMPHPRDWKLCARCKGKACEDCGMTGYALNSGAAVPETAVMA